MRKFLLILTIVWGAITIGLACFVFTAKKHSIHHPFYAFAQTKEETIIDLTFWGRDFIFPGDEETFSSNLTNIVFVLSKDTFSLGSAVKDYTAGCGLAPRFLYGKVTVLTNGEKSFEKTFFPLDQAIVLGIYALLTLLLIIFGAIKRKK